MNSIFTEMGHTASYGDNGIGCGGCGFRGGFRFGDCVDDDDADCVDDDDADDDDDCARLTQTGGETL